MISRQITAETDAGPMTVLLWQPEGAGPFPVVICNHAGPGLGEDIYSTARRLAGQGYLAAVPDLYHRHGAMLTFDIAELMKGPDSPLAVQLTNIRHTTTPDLMLADTRALIRALQDDSAAAKAPWGIMGFCHTARVVLLALAELPDIFACGTIMHPGMTVTSEPDSPHRFVQRIRGEIYAGFGAVDVLVPLDEQQPLISELRKLGDRALIEIHERGGHGFLWPGPAYDSEAESSAWANTFELFARNLPISESAG